MDLHKRESIARWKLPAWTLEKWRYLPRRNLPESLIMFIGSFKGKLDWHQLQFIHHLSICRLVSALKRCFGKLFNAEPAVTELPQKEIDTARVLKKKYSTEDWNLSKTP